MAHVSIDPSCIETGIWCDECGLPSGVRVALTTMDTDGVHRVDVLRLCHTDADEFIQH